MRGRWSAGNRIALGRRAQKAVENPTHLPVIASQFWLSSCPQLWCDENLRLHFL